jgi:hypothetical protein
VVGGEDMFVEGVVGDEVPPPQAVKITTTATADIRAVMMPPTFHTPQHQ